MEDRVQPQDFKISGQTVLCKILYLNPVKHIFSAASHSPNLSLSFTLLLLSFTLSGFLKECLNQNPIFSSSLLLQCSKCLSSYWLSASVLVFWIPSPPCHSSTFLLQLLPLPPPSSLCHPRLDIFHSAWKHVLCPPTSIKTECPVFPWPDILLLFLCYLGT